MKRRLLFLSAATGTLAIAVCSVITACGDDDSGSTFGAHPDSGVDANAHASLPPPSDAPPVYDAGPDVQLDALYPTAWDRSKSARDASLEASTKYCSDPTLGIGQFCWDFTGDDGISGWTEQLADGGANELVNGNAGDPLRSLGSYVNFEAGAGPHWVALRYLINIDDIADKSAGFTISFSFHLPSAKTYAEIGGVQIGTTAGPAFRGLAVYPTCFRSEPCIGENESPFDGGTDLADRVPFDSTQWYRANVHLQPVDLTANPVQWKSTIDVGGKTIASHTTNGIPGTNAFPSSVNLYFGVYNTTVAGNTSVEIDDIFVQ
jgi:hypothetical protein